MSTQFAPVALDAGAPYPESQPFDTQSIKVSDLHTV